MSYGSSVEALDRQGRKIVTSRGWSAKSEIRMAACLTNPLKKSNFSGAMLPCKRRMAA
jgi:hypothetical protein